MPQTETLAAPARAKVPYRQVTKCRVCGKPELVPVLSLGEQCLTGVFPRGAAEPITRGPLELVKCHDPDGCGLLQLRHSYDGREMYGDNYGYRSSLNRSMVDHLRAKVQGLLARFPVSDGDL